MVVQADSTLAAIVKKVRRLTASSSESALPTADIEQYINTFYNQDFPYAIKLDQLRSVYSFYTSPNVDRYPLDVNYNQGIRAPVYFEGITGYFFKDRNAFFNMWPRWPTQFQQSPAAISGAITAITNANPAQVTSAAHGLTTGDYVTIEGVSGMTQINGLSSFVTIVDVNNFTLDSIDSTAFGVYTGGGTWSGTSRNFTFALGSVPFLSTQVVIGGRDVVGGIIRITDDGGSLAAPRGNDTTQGNLLLINTNNVGDQVPAAPNLSPLPNPLPLPTNSVGTVNYVTGQFIFTIPVPLAAGTTLNIWVSQYQVARPYTLLFWNNEFTVRPVPDNVYKVEIETYLTPVQFMNTTDNPTLNQWWQYIAIGAAIKVLEDRQDMEGIQNLSVLFDRQEALVLERQGVEEIGQRNATIFSQTVQGQGWNNGFGQGWY